MLIASLIIMQLLIFAGLIYIFRRIMTQNVVLATKHLDELSQDYNEKEKKVNKEVEESKAKAQEIISKAQEDAEKVKTETIKAAEAERDRIISGARSQGEEIIKQADKSRQQLLREIEERIAKASITKACELIQVTLPDELKQVVHKQWIADLIEQGFGQVQRLRIPENLKEARIISAFDLTDEERKKISQKLKDALGREMDLKEEVDPRLVAGIVINLESLVLDGSLRNKIQEKAR